MNHESSQFDVGYTVTSDKYCNWFQHLLVDWWLNDRSILLRFFWFQTLKLRVTEFRFICWLIEMRWVGTFKPHLILSNLLIVVIQLTFMEFSSWHPIKTPLISSGPFDISDPVFYFMTHAAWVKEDRWTVRRWSRDQPIPGPPQGFKNPHELSEYRSIQYFKSPQWYVFGSLHQS